MRACSTGSGTSSIDMQKPLQGWKAVAVNISSGYEDELVGMVSHKILGARSLPDGCGESTVELFVGTDVDMAALAASVSDALRRLGFDPGKNRPVVFTVPDGNWVENYQKSLRPFPAGDRFLIHPGEERPDCVGDRIPIRLVPGRAFGTGEHATTRLCLAALERTVRTGSRWLDVGCGSGILAVAAAGLGAGAVTAVDNDPEAVEVCREVVTANGAAGTVQVLEGSLEGIERSGYDGVVANIHAPFLLENAMELAGLLRSGGALICTGFLTSELPEITGILEDSGLLVRASGQDGEWAMIQAELQVDSGRPRP